MRRRPTTAVVLLMMMEYYSAGRFVVAAAAVVVVVGERAFVSRLLRLPLPRAVATTMECSMIVVVGTTPMCSISMTLVRFALSLLSATRPFC